MAVHSNRVTISLLFTIKQVLRHICTLLIVLVRAHFYFAEIPGPDALSYTFFFPSFCCDHPAVDDYLAAMEGACHPNSHIRASGWHISSNLLPCAFFELKTKIYSLLRSTCPP